MIYYLIYLRVSSDKQDVEMQHTKIFGYLDSKHGKGQYRYELFSDPDTSTGIAMAKRKGLQEMLSCVNKNVTVIVYNLDRLSRDIIEMVTIYREITKGKSAKVYSLSEPELNEFTVGLMGAFAQKVRDDIRKKTVDGLNNKKAKGERYSGYLPYGYRLHETKLIPIKVGDTIVMKRGVLIPIYEEQQALHKMQQLADQGFSYQEIANQLTELGYLNREDKPFQKMTIYRILRRREKATLGNQTLHVEEPQSSLALTQ